MTEQLKKKVAQAIQLLVATAPQDGSPVEVAYSGGKDSDVILQLVKESGIPYRAIYKNTTIDPPGTIAHAEKNGAEIIRPKHTFAQILATKGQPNRRRRFCCEQLKEYKILDKVVTGIRKCESESRDKRYNEPTQCRVYGNGEKSEHVMPILYWSNEDVKEFIADRKIKCAPVYYDESGSFHVERRLGCIGCPLATRKNRLNEFKKYPGMIQLYITNIQKYIDNHPNGKMAKMCVDAYGAFYRDVLFKVKRKKGVKTDTNAQWLEYTNTIFGRPDFKMILENYFGVILHN